MPDPIVFISRHRIKPGKWDEFTSFMRAATPMMEASKPRTLSLLAYANEDFSELTIVHAFADAESFDEHLQGAGGRSQRAYAFIEPQSFSVYGPASDSALESMRRQAAQVGADFDLKPEFVTGFLRLQPPS